MIDWDRVDELKSEVGAENFTEIADLFLAEMEQHLAALPATQTASDLREILHAMKGSALNLGFEQFATFCAEGEARAAAGDPAATDPDEAMWLYHASKEVFCARMGPTAAA